MHDKIKEAAYEHQEDTWEEARNRELLSYDTGTGKTLVAIGLCLQRVDSATIVVPLSVLNKWVEEIKRWCDDVSVEETHDRWKLVVADEVRFFIVTKEWFRDNLDDVPGMEALVIDEAHYFSGMKSQMSKAAIKYVKGFEVEYRWLLTATPYRSTPWNIYRLAQILGYDWSYPQFERKYFQPRHFGKRKVMVPKDNLQEDMAKLVDYIGRIVHISEAIDVPDQVTQVEHIPLRKEQEDAIEDINMRDINPIVRYTKHHQIENGVLIEDEYNEDKTFSNHKINRIKDYIGERDKVAVACRYNDQLEYIEDKIDPDKDVYKIWGGDSNREETISDIQDADKCVVLVNAAVSEGYEFPSISLMVFASLSFSYVDYRQMKGRLLRMDNPSKNVYVHLVTQRDGDDNETVDEAVYDNVVNKKQKFDAKIYAQEKGDFSEV